jgi:hypothetical protein
MCGCALKPSFASAPARPTIRANPAVLKGAPRSDVNTKGDLGSCSRWSRHLRPAEWGIRDQFARQQSRAAHVRFGSKADIGLPLAHVRFTPKSGHCRTTVGAKLGLSAMRQRELLIDHFVEAIAAAPLAF